MTSDLDETQLRILHFLCRHIPPGAHSPVFETRITICGELRLALHEYDQACTGLKRLRLIATDPPYANDCDSITLTSAGRHLIEHL